MIFQLALLFWVFLVSAFGFIFVALVSGSKNTGWFCSFSENFPLPSSFPYGVNELSGIHYSTLICNQIHVTDEIKLSISKEFTVCFLTVSCIEHWNNLYIYI